MPTDTERRLNELEEFILFGGGVGIGALSSEAGRAIGRRGVRGAGRHALRLAGTGGRMGMLAARAHPVGTALTLAYLGYIHRDEVREVAEALGEGLEGVAKALPGGNGAGIAKKRAVSKANKAVKQGMANLKAGTKASTGADKGVMPAGAFKTATKAAGLANPKTPSKIGKGKSKVKNLARKIKRWW